jgi:hypothetical protein
MSLVPIQKMLILELSKKKLSYSKNAFWESYRNRGIEKNFHIKKMPLGELSKNKTPIPKMLFSGLEK